MAAINVLKKNDGFWIHFRDNKFNSTIVHVDKFIDGSGPIVRKVILDACEQLVLEALGSSSSSSGKGDVNAGT